MEQASREHAFPAASQVKQNLDGAGLIDFGITLFPGLAGGEKEHGEDGLGTSRPDSWPRGAVCCSKVAHRMRQRELRVSLRPCAQL